MSRSCQSGWSSSAVPGVAAQQPGQAGDPLGQDRIALVGHRLGALLAGRERLLELADLGVLEVADLGREPLERPAEDRRSPRAAPRGGRAGRSGVLTGSAWRPRAASTSASISGPRWLYVPTGPEILPVRDLVDGGGEPRRAPRSTSNAQPASLRPSVVGSAWTEWVRPIITVSASARARTTIAASQPVGVGEEAPAGRRELERERRCRRRRCSSGRGGGSGPPGRPTRRPG